MGIIVGHRGGSCRAALLPGFSSGISLKQIYLPVFVFQCIDVLKIIVTFYNFSKMVSLSFSLLARSQNETDSVVFHFFLVLPSLLFFRLAAEA